MPMTVTCVVTAVRAVVTCAGERVNAVGWLAFADAVVSVLFGGGGATCADSPTARPPAKGRSTAAMTLMLMAPPWLPPLRRPGRLPARRPAARGDCQPPPWRS